MRFFVEQDADVAAFQELKFFNKSENLPTHRWTFQAGPITFADALAGVYFPSASGNYFYTKKSWEAAGGHPEDAHALDAWGFGIRQVATGQKTLVSEGSFYFHRYGHDCYFTGDSREGNMNLAATQILAPFADLIFEEDYREITGSRANDWFYQTGIQPIRLRSGETGRTGGGSVITS